MRPAVAWPPPVSCTNFPRHFDASATRLTAIPRRCMNPALVVDHFPFNIFYRPAENEVVVVAVAHQKWRPGYWAAR